MNDYEKERAMLLEGVLCCAQFLELLDKESELFDRGLKDLEMAVERVEALEWRKNNPSKCRLEEN